MPTHEEQVAFKKSLWDDHIARCNGSQSRVDAQIAAENRRILLLPLVPFAYMIIGILGVAIWIMDRECLQDWFDIT